MAANKTVRGQAAPHPAAGIDSKLHWLVPLAVVAVTLFAFLPALHHEFLTWDDEDLLIKNPHYRGLGWAQLRWMLTTFHFGHYQPLTWMSFGLDYLLWGMEPSGYHFTSLFLHAANALLFYLLAFRLLESALPISTTHQQARALRLAAGVAALFFSIHPLRVESVAWVTERRDVLSGLFFLGTLICYLDAAATQPGRRRMARLAAALLLYGFSLLAKGAGMTLPVVLVVLDIYPLKRLGGPGKWFGREARLVWLEKAPFLTLGVIAAIVAAAAQYHSGAMLSMERHGLVARLVQAFYGLAFYIWKTVLPFNLAPLYEIPQRFQPSDWPFLLSAIVVLGLSIGLVVVRRRWPAGLAVWICYLAILAPTLGVAQSGPQFVADRYSYLSCLGWAILAGAAFYRFRQPPGIQKMAHSAVLMMTTLVALVLAVFAVLTWKQTMVWRNTESLWRHAVQATPESGGAHYNLAVWVEGHGKSEQAEQHYRQALEINPGYMRAHNNLGVMLARQNRLAEAIEHYNKALEIDPNSAEAHNNVGNALFRVGHVDEASRHYKEALRNDPAYARAHNGLGIVLAKQGRLEEAMIRFRSALEIDPAFARAHVNLGNILVNRGELKEAEAHYRRALDVEPRLAAAHEALGRILALQGRREEAVRHMEEALRIMKAAPEHSLDQDGGRRFP